jgi:hypothetical protein
MVRLIRGNNGDVYSDSFGLNIWWNLSILRDTLKAKLKVYALR